VEKQLEEELTKLEQAQALLTPEPIQKKRRAKRKKL
jgi:hypothetical protein